MRLAVGGLLGTKQIHADLFLRRASLVNAPHGQNRCTEIAHRCEDTTSHGPHATKHLGRGEVVSRPFVLVNSNARAIRARSCGAGFRPFQCASTMPFVYDRLRVIPFTCGPCAQMGEPGCQRKPDSRKERVGSRHAVNVRVTLVFHCLFES